MDIYPISFVKIFASIVAVSEQQKARPGSTAAHKSSSIIGSNKNPDLSAAQQGNGRNGSAKGKILPLKPKISGTEC
jgi:hypothetical protein